MKLKVRGRRVKVPLEAILGSCVQSESNISVNGTAIPGVVWQKQRHLVSL